MASGAIVFVTWWTRAVGETATCDVTVVFVTRRARRKDEMVMVAIMVFKIAIIVQL